MAAVPGLRGTGDWASDERPKDFREMILWMNPNGDSPLTALMGKMGKEIAKDPEVKWFDEPHNIFRLQINKSGDYGTSDITLVVDSGDPSASDIDAPYGLATHLVPNDMLLVEKTDEATYDNEILRVINVLSSTSFVVERGFAGTTPAAIVNDALLTYIGNAQGEGTASPEASSRNPLGGTNFCQIFKTAYDLTGTALATTNLRTGDPLKNDKIRAMFKHSMALELAILFGRSNDGTGGNQKPLRTMGGLREFIPSDTVTIFSATPTTSTLLDAIYKVFDFQSPAGDTRIGFTGNLGLNAINKVLVTAGTVNFGPVLKVYGMNLREYIMPQGRLLIRTHPLLNLHPRYSASMFIVDPSALRWRYLKGRDTHPQDNIQNRDEDTRKGQWFTEGTIEVRHGGRTCAYLGKLNL